MPGPARSVPLLLSMLALAGVAACGGDADRNGARPVTISDIRSTDFALLPCLASRPDAPCVLVAAGGKRLLFGTPPGVSTWTDAGTLGSLDAVLLFSLEGRNLEGLDEVRNQGWREGREAPLPVGGPAGTREVLGALNKAYEVSDAQIFVQDPPRGGFGAALLGVLPGEGEAKAQVFNTGDLVVTKIETADGMAGYWLDYGGKRAVLQPCGADNAVRFNEQEATILACDGGDATMWSLEKPLYLVQDGRVEPG